MPSPNTSSVNDAPSINRPVGIIGGTHFDARLGEAFFQQQGVTTVARGISDTPEEASALQILSPFKLHRMVVNELNRLKQDHDIHTVCLYCNSLSAAIDPAAAAEETGLRVITPLDVYRLGADRYRRMGLMAANCQSLGGIEKVILTQNEAAQVIGAAMLEIAVEIEKGTDPREILRSFGLLQLVRFFEAAAVEVLILGCTHFPYLKASLEGVTAIPLLDPAAEMVWLCQSGE
ncbi:aspartate/glutamate racemase family protein [Anoxynatronum buryatiense]|uniref:Glutamate racemase n=1 Tax=Anoxynatronum buryatiense TaxID=489973 RepID=A0AA45WXR3_9CLOT|nr:aspartate/glutamate racemase family protein [Anoxynatronum buryatiense]SMP65784.1 glutamate racemase [Anoxynatronum buryatiense]